MPATTARRANSARPPSSAPRFTNWQPAYGMELALGRQGVKRAAFVTWGLHRRPRGRRRLPRRAARERRGDDEPADRAVPGVELPAGPGPASRPRRRGRRRLLRRRRRRAVRPRLRAARPAGQNSALRLGIPHRRHPRRPGRGGRGACRRACATAAASATPGTPPSAPPSAPMRSARPTSTPCRAQPVQLLAVGLQAWRTATSPPSGRW